MLKRRTLVAFGLGSFTAAVGGRYFFVSKKPIASGSQIARAVPLDLSADLSDALFQFAVVGDVGTGKDGQYAIARSMTQQWQSSPFSIALLTGDNIYSEGEIEKVSDAFERPYADLLKEGVKFYAALGNHDFQTNQGEDEIAYSGYNMSARYYTFTEQSVQFFALDTNLAEVEDGGGQAWKDQLQWLRAELARSPALWKIVFAHHPVYSSGYHGSSTVLIESLTPIFAEYGVQLYLNGHDHNYERTKPIHGTTYITSGNGAVLRPVGESDWTAYAVSQLGFNTVAVYPDRIVVEAIDRNNEVYDAVAITATQT